MKKQIQLIIFILAIFGAVIILMNSCKKNNNNGSSPLPGTVTDIDGNVYHTIKIGTQMWMVENLKTTRFNDGTSIPLVSDFKAWGNLSTSGYCWYNNDPSTYKTTYGALYNWYAINTGKLAPKGWHIPTDPDWIILTTFLGGVNVAGGKMREAGEVHWKTPNTGATNSSGFTALPGGGRHWIDGSFGGIGSASNFWSSTELDSTNAWGQLIYYDSAYVYHAYGKKTFGFSCRCLQDN